MTVFDYAETAVALIDINLPPVAFYGTNILVAQPFINIKNRFSDDESINLCDATLSQNSINMEISSILHNYSPALLY